MDIREHPGQSQETSGFLRRGAIQGLERRQRLQSDYLVHVQV